MVDFRATVFDGSFHAVDSNELSFKMAGSLAFKDGMSRARPTLQKIRPRTLPTRPPTPPIRPLRRVRT